MLNRHSKYIFNNNKEGRMTVYILFPMQSLIRSTFFCFNPGFIAGVRAFNSFVNLFLVLGFFLNVVYCLSTMRFVGTEVNINKFKKKMSVAI